MICPVTGKVAHRTKGAAYAAIASLTAAQRGSLDFTVYPCGNHWHYGHDAKKLTKRIRTALSSTPRPTRRRR